TPELTLPSPRNVVRALEQILEQTDQFAVLFRRLVIVADRLERIVVCGIEPHQLVQQPGHLFLAVRQLAQVLNAAPQARRRYGCAGFLCRVAQGEAGELDGIFGLEEGLLQRLEPFGIDSREETGTTGSCGGVRHRVGLSWGTGGRTDLRRHFSALQSRE